MSQSPNAVIVVSQNGVQVADNSTTPSAQSVQTGTVQVVQINGDLVVVQSG